MSLIAAPEPVDRLFLVGTAAKSAVIRVAKKAPRKIVD